MTENTHTHARARARTHAQTSQYLTINVIAVFQYYFDFI